MTLGYLNRKVAPTMIGTRRNAQVKVSCLPGELMRGNMVRSRHRDVMGAGRLYNTSSFT